MLMSLSSMSMLPSSYSSNLSSSKVSFDHYVVYTHQCRSKIKMIIIFEIRFDYAGLSLSVVVSRASRSTNVAVVRFNCAPAAIPNQRIKSMSHTIESGQFKGTRSESGSKRRRCSRCRRRRIRRRSLNLLDNKECVDVSISLFDFTPEDKPPPPPALLHES